MPLSIFISIWQINPNQPEIFIFYRLYMTEKSRFPLYGGQAVIEGVMMRGTQSVAIAMRNPDNEISIHKEPLSALYRHKIIKIPFLRGFIMLIDALILGTRALTISANTQTGDEAKIEGPTLYLTLFLSLAIGIGLFFLAPAALGQASERILGIGAWWGNLLEGLVRLFLLVGYIWAVGKMSDIRRVFAYHGAEHKTINAYEARAVLTPENVAHYSVEHPRCGTAFLLTLVLLSILIFSLLGPLPFWWRMASRILFLPVLACLAYEYIRWTANHLDSKIVQLIVKPNLALQHLTTREPDRDMLEVAIAAFNAMRSEENIPI
jgi:uncharacterized protein YqhQ